MKRIFLTIIVTLTVILCSSSGGFAQADPGAMAYLPKDISDNITLATSSVIPSSGVNMKAVRDFAKKFSKVNNAKWYQTSESFVAEFTENQIQTKVIYDLKGNWHCMLRTYGEASLPFDVRDLVKSKYYDFDIMVVYEIAHADDLTYILKIEDSKKIKILRVSNGEMEVIGDYVRG